MVTKDPKEILQQVESIRSSFDKIKKEQNSFESTINSNLETISKLNIELGKMADTDSFKQITNDIIMQISSLEKLNSLLSKTQQGSNFGGQFSKTQSQLNNVFENVVPNNAPRRAISLVGRDLEKEQGDLNNIKSNITDSFSEINEQLKNTATFAPELSKKLSDLSEAYNKQSSIVGALKKQEDNKFDNNKKLAENITRNQGVSSFQERIQSGQFGNLKEAENELKKTSESVASALRQISKEEKEYGEATQSSKNKLNSLTNEYKNQAFIVDELQKGSSQSQSRWKEKAVDYAGRTVGLAQYGLISSEIQETNLRGRFASTINQQYATKFAAAQGDMAALGLVESGAINYATKQAQMVKERTNTLGVAGAAASAVSAIPGFGGTGASGAFSAAQQAIMLGKGIPQAESELTAYEANMSAFSSVQGLQSRFRQRFMDVNLSGAQAATGMGSRASSVMDEITNASSLSQFKGFRPEQIQALYSQAAGSMGERFVNKSSQGRTGLIKRATELELSGNMGAQEYIGNVARSAQAGGGDKQFEEVMANAVSRGVDNAKNISDLNNSIVGMSDRLGGALGKNVYAGVQKQMLGAMSALGETNLPESLKQAAAITATERLNRLTVNQEMDMPTAIRLGRIQQLLPGAGPLGSLAIAKTSLADLQSYESQLEGAEGDPKKISAIQSTMRHAGLGGLASGNPLQNVRGQISAATETLVNSAVFLSEDKRESLLDVSKTKNEKQYEELLKDPDVSAFASISGFDALMGSGAGKVNTTPKGKLKDVASIKQTGAEQYVKEIEFVEKAAGSSAKALNIFASAIEQVGNNLDQKSSANAAAQAATGLTLNTSSFDSSVKTFEESMVEFRKSMEYATAMKEAANIFSGSVDSFKKATNSIVDGIAGAGKGITSWLPSLGFDKPKPVTNKAIRTDNGRE